MGADQNLDLRAHIAGVLDWWHDAGVDCLVDDVPRDWLARVAPSARPSSDPDTVSPARKLPDTLTEFLSWRIGSEAPEAAWPGVAMPAQGIVPGNGAVGIMVVVDMPDRDDESAGQLLSGPVGKLFDRMLAAIGLDRSSVLIAALAVKRPPAARITGDMVPTLEALLRHQIALAAPKRILALGGAASRAVTGTDAADARGRLHTINHDGGKTEAVASYHPRFLLERPAAKADAWRDLQMLTGGLK